MVSRSSSEPLRVARVALLCAALAWLASGCVTVKPADRELLADPAMTYGHDGPSAVHESHVLDNREGAFGAGEASGGGCGCN